MKAKASIKSIKWSLLCITALVVLACSDDGPEWEPLDIVTDRGDAGEMEDAGEYVENPDCPGSGIVISEFVYDPLSGAPEWVELAGPVGRDLTGFHLVGVNGNGGAVYSDVPLEGGLGIDGFFLVADGELAGADQLDAELELQNGPDNLQLRDCVGQIVDAVGYGDFGSEDIFAGEGSPAPETGDGEALARCPGANDANDNSQDFHVSEDPTPGVENGHFSDPYACEPCVGGLFDGKVVINEILYNPDQSDVLTNEFLELRGNANLDLFGLTVQFVNGANGDTYESFTLNGPINPEGLFTIGDPTLANFPLPEMMQNGPDSVRLLDCEGSVVDALAYGTFDEGEFPSGEGTSAEGARESYSLARCDGESLAEIDSNDNAADFYEATPSPYAANTGFTDVRACGGTGCAPGLLTDRVMINEFLPGDAGFIELKGEANLGMADVTVEVLDGAGSVLNTYELTGSLNGTGYYALDATAIVAVGGTLLLRDCEDVTVDAVAWGAGDDLRGEGSPAATPATGQALGRCPGAIDTDNNANDFKLIDVPTRGGENGGFVDPDECGIFECVPGALAGHVVINELLYDPTGPDGDGPTFLELRGDPGTDLTEARLVYYNRDSGNQEDELELTGDIPESGYYLLGQNLGVTADFTTDFAEMTNTGGFVHLFDCDGQLVDAVGYGAVTAVGLGEGPPAPGSATNSGQSVARCAGDTLVAIDSGNNGEDFDLSINPTPGTMNRGFTGDTCPPGPCDNPLTDRVLINEFLPNEPGTDTAGTVHWSFVELRGVPGTDLQYSRFEFVNGAGSTVGDEDVYQTHTLTGIIPDATGGDVAGYYVVGESDVPNLDQTVSMDLQNGADSIRLVDSCGNVIDAVGYGSFGTSLYFAGEGNPVTTVPNGGTLGRRPTANLSEADTGDNAADFCVIDPGPGDPTPGYAYNAGQVNPGCP